MSMHITCYVISFNVYKTCGDMMPLVLQCLNVVFLDYTHFLGKYLLGFAKALCHEVLDRQNFFIPRIIMFALGATDWNQMRPI